jgi:hypothetical protein
MIWCALIQFSNSFFNRYTIWESKRLWFLSQQPAQRRAI